MNLQIFKNDFSCETLCKHKVIVRVFIMLAAVSCLLFLSSCSRTEVTHEIHEEVRDEEEHETITYINPLNGAVLDDEALLLRHIIAVKVENEFPARPQSGLGSADMVYEQLVEGGATRFIGLFLQNESEVVGPIRSARTSDIDILLPYDPLLVCSGGAPHVLSAIRASGLPYVEEDGAYMWRDRSRRAPHNLYTSTPDLRHVAAEKCSPVERIPESGFEFHGPTPDDESSDRSTVLPNIAAREIDIGYDSGYETHYAYNEETGRYGRFVAGSPLIDMNTGEQLSPKNVIIQFVEISNSGGRDSAGTSVPVLNTVGSGNAILYSGSKVIFLKWRKQHGNAHTVFADARNNPLKLDPGQTWIHLIPGDIKVNFR